MSDKQAKMHLGELKILKPHCLAPAFLLDLAADIVESHVAPFSFQDGRYAMDVRKCAITDDGKDPDNR